MNRSIIGRNVPSHLVERHATFRYGGGQRRISYQTDDPVGVQQIVSAISIIMEHLIAGKQAKASGHWLRVIAPYTFTRLDSGLILPLNRDYRPPWILTSTINICCHA